MRRLPAGVFLWRDEFERAFNQILSGYPPQGLKLRPSGFAFIFDPQIEDVPRKVIMAGFGEFAPVAFDSTLSLDQTRAHLRKRLCANDYEIERWIIDGWIQAYRHHRLRDNDSCSKAEPWRDDPDGNGPEVDHSGRPKIFEWRRFLQDEVEQFDPSRPSGDDWNPTSYPEFGLAELLGLDDPRDHIWNPSGRFISFSQAVAFLRALKDIDEDTVVQRLRSEVDEGRIDAGWIADKIPDLEHSYFPESQILGMAVTRFGWPFDGWDAVTRQDSPLTISEDRPRTEIVKSIVAPTSTLDSAPQALDAAGIVPWEPPDTAGMVKWHVAILDAWPDIMKAHGTKPNARAVLRWIKKSGPRDVIPDVQPLANELRWIDTDGNHRTTPIHTLETLLSLWRKKKMIPAE